MDIKRGFIETGKWYKGNTHSHTIISDGNLNPQELKELYKSDGYSFLTITDHRVYGVHEDLNEKDFIILPGVELDRSEGWLRPGGYTFCDHIVGIGLPGENTFEHGYKFTYDPQKLSAMDIVDLLKENGNVAIYAHPIWSHKRMEEMDELTGILGLEIYNNNCHIDCFAGHADSYLDRLLWDGKEAFCFAADDTHRAHDALGGYIVVKAEELTHEAIMDSILKGSFYASNGPEIKDFYIEDNVAYLECSPCVAIGFSSDSCVGGGSGPYRGLIEKSHYPVYKTDSYVRAFCMDEKGNKAWTQPIWVK